MNIKEKLWELYKILETYGPEHCSLEEMLKNVAPLLRTVIINIDKNDVKPISIISYIVTIFGFTCYFYIYLFSAMWCVFVRYRRSGYFLGSIIVFSLATITETCAIRFLCMLINSKTIREAVDRYRLCDAQIDPSSRLAHNILKHLKVVKKRTTFGWLALVINAYIYITLPYFLPGKQFAENRLIIYGLDPMTESPNYEIAQVMYFFAMTTATHSITNCTAFIFILFGYTEASLYALSEELVSMWSDAQKHYEQHQHLEQPKSKIKNDFIQQRLKFIIKLHIENIALLKRLEHVLRFNMALEFLVLMAGLIAALLGGLQNTYLEVPFSFSQLFMSCYLGQKIIDASDCFETATYDCKWEHFNNSNARTVLVMLQNSQKTLQLSAGGVVILGYECLMSVIKSCYSFYTTLQSTIK